MDKLLTDLATAPTALVAAVANGRGRRSRKGISRLPGQARDALPDVLEWLEAIPDDLLRLLARKPPPKKVSMLIPHRKRSAGRQGKMKLARNLGAAASATVFAVDVISEVRRSAQARQQNSQGERALSTSSQPKPTAAKKPAGTSSVSPGKKVSAGSRKAVSANK